MEEYINIETKKMVEAVQWNGDNQNEFTEFVGKFAGKTTSMPHKGYLAVAYYDRKKRLHRADVPDYGWVVAEGKTLQFYEDETFRKTFKAAEKKSAERILLEPTLNKIKKQAQQTLDEAYVDVLEAMFGGCEKLSGKKPDKDVVDFIKDAAKMRKDPFFVPTNEDVCKDNDKKWHEGMEKKYKEWSAKHPESYTFDSVLDEMKELHEKKNKDYKGSFHDLFKEYGMPYALGHLEEKLNRVKAITANGGSAVKNEHIEDSVIDLANYAVMLYVELKNKENGKL